MSWIHSVTIIITYIVDLIFHVRLDHRLASLVWLVQEALCAPLPSGWSENYREDTEAVLYYNKETKQSSWGYLHNNIMFNVSKNIIYNPRLAKMRTNSFQCTLPVIAHTVMMCCIYRAPTTRLLCESGWQIKTSKSWIEAKLARCIYNFKNWSKGRKNIIKHDTVFMQMFLFTML